MENEVNQDVLLRPPPGTWLRQESDAIVVGATMRSKAAWFHIPFTIAWSGGSIYGIYGTQIIERNFNLIMSLFSIPFLIGTVFLIRIAIYMLFGRQEWRLDEDGGAVFNGVGRFGKRKRFAWKDLTRVHIHTIRGDKGNTSFNLITRIRSRAESQLPEHKTA